MNPEANFREVVDNNNLNKKISVLIVRAIIRYSTRYFGIDASINISKILLLVFKLKNKNSYNKYLIKNNIFRNNYYKISRSSLIKGQKHKIKWVEYLIQNSKDKAVLANAKEYLSVINHEKNKSIKINTSKKIINKTNNIFYIYGPNTSRPINLNYKNSILINLKPMSFNKDFYESSMLFINSYYYRNYLSKNKIKMEEVQNLYNRVYLSCNESELGNGVKRIVIENQGYLASLMGLGRILYYLSSKYEEVNCVIEGFDFYLNKEMYKGYYHKIDLEGQPLNNDYYITSLIDHDALYNFLYVKYVVSKLNLIDSEELKSILLMTGRGYLELLHKQRQITS